MDGMYSFFLFCLFSLFVTFTYLSRMTGLFVGYYNSINYGKRKRKKNPENLGVVTHPLPQESPAAQKRHLANLGSCCPIHTSRYRYLYRH